MLNAALRSAQAELSRSMCDDETSLLLQALSRQSTSSGWHFSLLSPPSTPL